jgi:septal ring factor EnvC (AmiA/AmiB activator)
MTEENNLRREIAEIVAAAVAPIAAAVNANAKATDSLTTQWAEQDRRAADSRSKLYDRMGAVETETARLSVHVQTTGREVSEVKTALAAYEPRLRAVEAFRNGATGELRGAGKIMGALRAVAMLAIGAGGMLATWWAFFRGGK